MNTGLIFIVINSITIATLLLSIIYTAGVVWRVEKELDISYKFFLAAVTLLLVAEGLNICSPDTIIRHALIVKALRMLFAICFLFGILFMRDLVRKMDGEKK